MNLFASMILQSFVRLVIYADQYYVGLAATAKDDEIMTQVKMKPPQSRFSHQKLRLFFGSFWTFPYLVMKSSFILALTLNQRHLFMYRNLLRIIEDHRNEGCEILKRE